LAKLDGEPGVRFGSPSSFGIKTLWFEITDDLRHYRPMPSLIASKRRGDTRV